MRSRLTWLLALFTLSHCSLNPQADLPSSRDSDNGTPGAGATGNVSATGGSATGAGAASGQGELPPEQKNALYEAPVVTGRLLWSANSQSGKVAVMDAETLVIKTFDAGYSPKYLAAVPTTPDASSAIVLNTGSHDATWFRLPEGLAGDPLTEFIPTREDANAWAVSPSGRWAIAWTDARLISNGNATDQYQNATVIDLSDAAPVNRATRLGSLGYRPSSISFDAEEAHALVVDQSPNGGPGITVIDLTGTPQVTRQIDLAPGVLTANAIFDVVVTADGKTALVRREGNSQVGVVDIATGQITTLELGGRVTDLDLSQDGSVAVAVVRDLSQVSVIDMQNPTAASPPSVTIPGEIFGSAALAADGSRTVLYTTAVPSYDHVSLLGWADPPSWRTVALKASVSSMFVAPPDAGHAVAILQVTPGSTVKGAFSLIPIAARLSPKIVSTNAPPTGVAIAPEGDRVLVTVRDDTTQNYGVYLGKLPSLEVNLLSLASPPVATGIVPAVRRGYVAQAHPEGRITVIDLENGTARTVTGFELAARVRYSN